ncbi:MAG TPA: VWA domain-containing protein, partial [Acidimicrobiia bacterium]|nr:VWA domain-containing protein [Acidimicrobiia bacterium]
MPEDSIAVDDRTSFIGMLVGFGDELRSAGVPVGSGDVLTYCAAMALLDPGDVLDLYWAGRTSLVSRRDHIPIYDRVFRAYFLDHPEELQGPARTILKQSLIENQSVIEVPATDPAQPGKEKEEEARLGLMASDIEIWRNKAFSACTDEELAALRRIMNQVKVIPPRRRSRRTTQSKAGSRPDLRRTVRTTMRTHGEPSELFWRQRRLKTRPLVLILDVSGSMADYSRNLLQFA